MRIRLKWCRNIVVLLAAHAGCGNGSVSDAPPDVVEPIGTGTQPPVPPAGAISLGPVADTYLQSGSGKAKNFGSAANVEADKDTSSTVTRGLIRFDLRPYSRIGSAKLRMYVTNESASSADFVVTSDDWKESVVTWETQPTARGALAGSVTGSKMGTFVTLDLTDVARAGGLLSLVVLPRSTDGYWFASRENGTPAHRPVLIVTASTSTGPGSSAPAVRLTAPTSGSTFVTPQTVAITANATSDVGIARVEFYDGAALLGTDTSSPFSFAWNVVAADDGAHSLTAKAFDKAGYSRVSAAVLTTVNIDGAIPPDAVHSRQYGTVGDGKANDTSALQAASNAAAGKTLYIEPGTYLTSGLDLNGPTRVIAAGATLKAAGGSAPLLAIAKTVRVEGIGLDGNGQKKPGLNVANVAGVVVTGCSIDAIDDTSAVTFDHATNFEFSGCTVRKSSVDSLTIFFSSGGKITNNTITDSGRHGMEWWGGDSANPSGPNGVTGLTFTGNVVLNSGRGGIWGSMGEKITITGNTVEVCGDVCIDAEGGTDATLSDNSVRNGKNGGITTFYAATNVEISHNTIVEDAGSGNAVMIYGQGTSRKISIVDNTMTTDGTDGVFTLDNTLSDSTVKGNTVTLKGGGKGIDIQGGSGNTVADNTVH